MTIIDQYGRPIKAAALREPQTSRITQLQNEYLTGYLDGLTPARLVAALRAADNGDLVQQHRIFADMEERDPHLVAEIGKRRLALLGLDWTIVPPRGATAAEKKATDWLTEVMTDAVDPIEDLLLALMDGVGHGFAPIELEWRDEGGERLPAYHPRPQEWFRLDRYRRELRLRDASADGAEPVPFGWAIHTHGKAKTGYLGRLGLHRVLVWPFLYKAYAIGDFAEFLETYGLPIIVGKYYQGASADERASLMRAVTSLGHDARAIMPADMQLEVQKITGGAGSTDAAHLAMVDWADRAQSKAILGQTMSAEAKASGLGSGNADLHREVRSDILAADAREIAGTVTRDVLYPILALNKGAPDGLRRCPRLVFDTGEPEDLAALADALPKLVGVGFRIPTEWAQERARIPMPQDDQTPILATGGAKPPLEPSEPPAPPAAAAAVPRKLPSVALNAAAAAAVPDQAAIDAALDAIPPENLQAHAAALIEPILQLLDQAGGYEQALRAFAERYPDLDTAGLEDLLARAMFAADLWGHGHAGTD